MTTVLLVRHAKAGSRHKWDGPDSARPLSAAGRRQADLLSSVLSGAGVQRILSSPFLRCRQTVEPLSRSLSLEVEPLDELAEGVSGGRIRRLLDKLHGDTVVLCTHGDVIGRVLADALAAGLDLPTDRMEKASVWILDRDDAGWTAARYLHPPGAQWTEDEE